MKTRFVALAVAATLGLGTVSAFAQTYHHDGRAAWQAQRAAQARRDWAYNHRYYGPSYNYRRDDGDVAGALLLGALTGALVGQASNAYSYNYAPPATYYAPPATYYAPPASYYTPPASYYNPGYNYYGY